MFWIAPSEKDTDNAALDKRLRSAADQFRANSGLKSQEYSTPVLGLDRYDDVRWQFGVPPKGNANFAWVQHFIHHLGPHGIADFFLANGSISTNQSGEGDIRRAIAPPYTLCD